MELDKFCSICKEYKSLETSFYHNSHNSDGYAGICKGCDSKKGKLYRQRPEVKARNIERREYHRKYKFFKLYGITLEDRQAMWIKQKGNCGICTKPMIGPKNCNLDHDHKTGRIRKLLCARCNYYLAGLEDDNFLQLATAYLKEFK